MRGSHSSDWRFCCFFAFFEGGCSHFPFSFLPFFFLSSHRRLTRENYYKLVYLFSFLLLLSILIIVSIGRMIKIHLSSQSFPTH